MKKDAIIDETKKYRYWLLRKWDDQLPTMTFLMLNPSTADANNDDPTIKRCMSFARDSNFGAIEVVNLFAYRATNPRDLLNCACSPIGEENNKYILESCKQADMIIAAWGVNGTLNSRNTFVENLVTTNSFDIFCLGVTNAGHPRHPLYLKGDTKPILYKNRVEENK